ncbi:MAG: cysteine desulfurase [Gemmatimonadota bacterium]
MSVIVEPAVRSGSLDVDRLRRDFPILGTEVHGKPLVYLDNAATSQKPAVVLEALARFYSTENANIHRGVHHLSERATEEFELARLRVARFLGARSPDEIVFTRGTTDAINLVAHSIGRFQFKPGDEIILSGMEHHSNIVPWQEITSQTGARLRVIPVTDAGELDLDAFGRLLSARTRMVAVTHVSNAIGTVNPLERIIAMAHEAGALVLVDGAQSAPHLPLDVATLGCDFFACSGHKMMGPTGIGVLFGRSELLDSMPPYQTGGGMIAQVSFEKTTFAPSPGRFEAGTPPIAGAIGLGAALEYLDAVGLEAIERHEGALLAYATTRLAEVSGLRQIGAGAPQRASVISFVMDGIHPHDVGTILDQEGIAIRAGHHCAQPLMARFGVPGTIRASFSFYNTFAEVDALVAGLEKVREVFV